MTSDAKMVVRYDEAKRAAVEQTLRKLVRTQGTLLLILGMLFGLMVLVSLIAAVTDGVDGAFVLAGVVAAFVLPASGLSVAAFIGIAVAYAACAFAMASARRRLGASTFEKGTESLTAPAGAGDSPLLA